MIKEIKAIIYAILGVLSMAAFGAVIFYIAIGIIYLIVMMGGHLTI